jgi:hypothetical protein
LAASYRGVRRIVLGMLPKGFPRLERLTVA